MWRFPESSGESFFLENRSTGDDLSARGGEQRQALAASIRAYWNKYGGMKVEERWFTILADDSAGATRWIEAAENIVRPVDDNPSPSSMFGGGGWVPVRTFESEKRPSRAGAEVLRKKTNPSVADLLAKRLNAV